MELQYQYFTGRFEGHHKMVLFYQSWRPVFCEKIIVIVHGLGEHSGRYRELIEAFVNEGAGFYAFDLRGHGRSKGQRGYIQSFSQLTDDLRAFLKLVSIHENNRPLVLLGHSLGGLICLRYLIECASRTGVAPTAVVLTNPTLKIAIDVPRWKEALSGWLSALAPRLSLYNELDLQSLSHDPAVVEAVQRDKLCHQRITGRFYHEILSAIAYVQRNVALIHTPMQILLGGEDRVIDPEGAKALFQHLALDQKILKVYPQFYHELFHEIGKEEVFSDIKRWLKTTDG